MSAAGELEHKRQKQQTIWMWNQIRENVMKLFKEHPSLVEKIPKYEHWVSKGAITPGFAADSLLEDFKNSVRNNVKDSNLEYKDESCAKGDISKSPGPS